MKFVVNVTGCQAARQDVIHYDAPSASRREVHGPPSHLRQESEQGVSEERAHAHYRGESADLTQNPAQGAVS